MPATGCCEIWHDLGQSVVDDLKVYWYMGIHCCECTVYKWVYKVIHGYTWVYMSIHGYTLVYMSIPEYTWVYVGIHGYTWYT